MRYGYARVSSTDQNLDRQLAAFKKLRITKIYKEQVSGKNADRPELQRMLQDMKKGDVLVITSLDRLSRNYDDIKRLWTLFADKGICISVLDNPVLSTDKGRGVLDRALSDMVLSLLAFVAENERQKIRERQAEGIALARAANKYKGRKVETDFKTFSRMLNRVEAGESVQSVCKAAGISRKTFYNLKKRYISQ